MLREEMPPRSPQLPQEAWRGRAAGQTWPTSHPVFSAAALTSPLFSPAPPGPNFRKNKERKSPVGDIPRAVSWATPPQFTAKIKKGSRQQAIFCRGFAGSAGAWRGSAAGQAWPTNYPAFPGGCLISRPLSSPPPAPSAVPENDRQKFVCRS